jgi:DNA-binding MarR family transcriptional regulator
VSTATSTASVNAEPPAELLVSVSELARRRKRDKALVSRQVARLVQEGKLKSYPGKGGTKLVNVAEFDRAVGETADAIREQAASTVRLLRGETDETPLSPPDAVLAPSDVTLAAAQRQKTLYEAELKKLELAERRGQVVAIAKVAEALARSADVIVQVIDRLPLRAAEVAAAVAKDGEMGARAQLKTAAYELRMGVAQALRAIENEGLAEEAAGPIEIEIPDDAVAS